MASPFKSDANTSMRKVLKTRKKKVKKGLKNEISDKSLFIFNKNNKFRILLKSFIDNPYVEGFVFHIIGLNCIFLAL